MERKQHLRILIANQRAERLERFAAAVADLGHEVVARELHVEDAAALTARERPDVALVGLGESEEHALEMITEIVRGSFCPVIALLDSYDADYVEAAASRGVYAYIVDTRPEELQSAIDITLLRFAEVQESQGAFERRDAEIAREAKLTQLRRRQLLELHDDVVQGLVLAKLNLELNRADETRATLLDALEKARLIVSQSLDELRSEGIPLADLLGDASAH